MGLHIWMITYFENSNLQERKERIWKIYLLEYLLKLACFLFWHSWYHTLRSFFFFFFIWFVWCLFCFVFLYCYNDIFMFTNVAVSAPMKMMHTVQQSSWGSLQSTQKMIWDFIMSLSRNVLCNMSLSHFFN